MVINKILDGDALFSYPIFIEWFIIHIDDIKTHLRGVRIKMGIPLAFTQTI